MILDGGLSQMVVNGCPEYLEGGMRLKRIWKLVPQEGEKKRNE